MIENFILPIELQDKNITDVWVRWTSQKVNSIIEIEIFLEYTKICKKIFGGYKTKKFRFDIDSYEVFTIKQFDINNNAFYQKAISYKNIIQQNIRMRQVDLIKLAEDALQSSFAFEKDAFILKFLEQYKQ